MQDEQKKGRRMMDLKGTAARLRRTAVRLYKNATKINAYWWVTIGFLILTFTAGDSNLYQRYIYDEKIRSLEKEIKHYQEEIRINSQKLEDLHTDKDGLERFAREEYHMKRSNEDVYIIKDK